CQIKWMAIGRRFRSADVGTPGKYDDSRASPVAIKMQRHLGILAHKIQAPGMSQAIDQKIGCSLIPPEPDRCGLRHPVHIHCGNTYEVLFMHAAPYTFPKMCSIVRKLKSHAPKSFLTSCSSAWWRKSERLVGSNSNVSSRETPRKVGTIEVIHSWLCVR